MVHVVLREITRITSVTCRLHLVSAAIFTCSFLGAGHPPEIAASIRRDRCYVTPSLHNNYRVHSRKDRRAQNKNSNLQLFLCNLPTAQARISNGFPFLARIFLWRQITISGNNGFCDLLYICQVAAYWKTNYCYTMHYAFIASLVFCF